MGKDTESIERTIEEARNQLAHTLDELSLRANPKRLADDAKQQVVAKLQQPKVKYTLVGIGAVLVTLIVVKIAR